MTKPFSEVLAGLKALAAKQSLSSAEKDLLQKVTSALEVMDRRLTALEGGDHSATAPISDTPQGETAPLSR